jgi:hypothetical protein
MASLDRELTAGPTPPRAGRWSDYTQLSRQIKQAGSAGPAAWVLHTAKIGLNLVLLAAGRGRLRRPGGLLVAAGDRRLSGGRLHPDRLRRPRRRPPADLPQPPRQRPGRPGACQPAGRDQLRLVGRQAQRPPHQPQPRGPGPRHRHPGPSVHRRTGPRQAGPSPGDRPLSGLPVLPAAAAGGRPAARRQRQGHPPGTPAGPPWSRRCCSCCISLATPPRCS